MKKKKQNMSTTALLDNDDYGSPQLFQTTLRQRIIPYLPPPIVKAIKEIDPRLEPYVGPEGCVNIFGSLLLGCLVYGLVRHLFTGGGSSSLGSGRNKAIQEDDRDRDILPSNKTSRPFDESFLLCGPSLAGKTSLFYQLVSQQSGNIDNRVKTVRSIKSNTGFLETEDAMTNDKSINKVLRILDTPAHWGPQKLIKIVPLQDIDRILVVVDSTQPVAQAADYLYAILRKSSNNHSNVLISCHKSDHPKAKNARRIKLQLRSELIRLSKLDDNDEIDDWEEILNAIPFCSSNVGDMDVVRDFCKAGTMPSSSSKK